ncbi:MAG: hypothetical protein U5J63_13090 [Fodinibius sp.]|nr:hypothetical protein [Fodinibius sp.]
MRLFKLTCYAIAVSLTLLGCGATGPDEGDEEEPTEYELSVSTSPSAGGSVNPSNGTYEEGAEVTIEASSNEGWTFAGWSGDRESDDNPLTITMDSDTELTANFNEQSSEPTEYSLSATSSPSEGGSVEPTDSTYEAGTEVTVEATSNEGMELLWVVR